jgi:osmotically-inducible protein OsmY
MKIKNHPPYWNPKPPRILIAATGGLLLALSPLLAEQHGITDTGITLSIESDMRGYDGIAAHLIDVQTEEGIVTLSGYVDNLLAREQAVTLAKSIKGVRSVIDQIKVRPVIRPDAEIRQDAIAALAADPATDSWEVTVTVKNGEVTLAGSTDSWQEKQLAAQIVKSVRGVREVKNHMVYIPTVNRPDTEIAKDIRQRLKMDVRVNAGGIEVEVMDGQVELSGLVASDAEKTLAEQLAWVTSARNVDSSALRVDFDRMAVLPEPRTEAPEISDQAIASALQKTFEMDPRVKAFAIETMVSSGTVTLKGEVDNYVAKLAAERDARNTVGVHFVINLLKVRPHSLIEDGDLMKNVESALSRSPYLDTENLDVAVRNSRVTLEGEVDSTFAINEAYRTVARVNGVASINNQLTATTTRIPAHGLDYAWHDYVPDAYWPFQDIPESLDAKIQRDVESQLFWSPFLDSAQIEVQVDDGTVKLTGFVDDYVERRIATKNAWEGGAQGVLNRLEVR